MVVDNVCDLVTSQKKSVRALKFLIAFVDFDIIINRDMYFNLIFVGAGQDLCGPCDCMPLPDNKETFEMHSQLPGVLRDRGRERGVFGVPESSKTSSSNDLAKPFGLIGIG
jgi:hypothetical protein